MIDSEIFRILASFSPPETALWRAMHGRPVRPTPAQREAVRHERTGRMTFEERAGASGAERKRERDRVRMEKKRSAAA